MVELCPEASKAMAYIVELEPPNTFYTHKTIIKNKSSSVRFLVDYYLFQKQRLIKKEEDIFYHLIIIEI